MSENHTILKYKLVLETALYPAVGKNNNSNNNKQTGKAGLKTVFLEYSFLLEGGCIILS